MEIRLSETLTVNGTPVPLSTAVAQACTELSPSTQPMVDNYSEMILGVANAHQLTQEQKDFIIEMLEDQLNIELQCVLMNDPNLAVEEVLDIFTVYKG
jgi:hypothetical protein